MNGHELLNRLALGELSNLSMADTPDGTIKPESVPKILMYINSAMLRLYSRFILLEKNLLIRQLETLTNYKIDKAFSLMGYDPAKTNNPYILDSNRAPYQQDLIKILLVQNECGKSYPLNDDTHPRSLYTPQPTVLQVPHPRACEILNVSYQAKHVTITEQTLDDEVIVPEVLQEALTAYVGYLTYNNLNSDTGRSKAKDHHDQYEDICTRATESDALSTSMSNSPYCKLEHRGFV